MSQQAQLLPCPFCGEAAEIYSAVTRIPNEDGSLQGHYVVDCTECNASIEFCNSIENAASLWNTRAESQALREENLRMREFISSLTDASGPYKFLDHTPVISAVYEILNHTAAKGAL